jgi:glycosyltransferase involved in cell wall biosynthesis
LLAQTYQNIEIVVVDDASDDATGAVVEEIATQDQRVRYVKLPCNVGTFVAKNIGLEFARGDFITCQDSDDWAHPRKIELQMQPLLQNSRLIVTTSHWVRLQDDGLFYARSVYPLMRHNPASPLFRRQPVQRYAGSWDCVRTGADSEFIARLKLVFGHKAVYRIKKPLTFGAHRPDSLMTAVTTGYTAEGISATRLAYWEAWGHWHIDELRAGRKPRMPVGLTDERPFQAPEAIAVSRAQIATVRSVLKV